MNSFHLVLIQLAVFEGGLPLRLEGDDDETNKDVDHEEGNDDDVDKVEDCYVAAVVVFWTHINLV